MHDVLGMHLNRITVAEAAAPGHPPARKAYEVGAGCGAGCAARASLLACFRMGRAGPVARLPAPPPVCITSCITTRGLLQVDDADFFWNSHGKEQFPKIAEQVGAFH